MFLFHLVSQFMTEMRETAFVIQNVSRRYYTKWCL